MPAAGGNGASLAAIELTPTCLNPAEEVPAEGHTDGRFSVKCRWYRSVVTKGGQVRAVPAAEGLRKESQTGLQLSFDRDSLLPLTAAV
jgi:hypothetical protein